jgi:hypothetical protein
MDPVTLNIDEFVQFNQTYAITGTEVTITNITGVATGVNAVAVGSSVRVYGQFNDAFTRSLTYLDTSNNPVTVNKFEALPMVFNTLYKYIAPIPSTITKTIIVNYTYTESVEGVPTPNTPGSLQIDVIVRNNFESANKKMAEAVSKGKY